VDVSLPVIVVVVVVGGVRPSTFESARVCTVIGLWVISRLV